jgi:DNA-binding transcriptional LysR family regulator
MLNLDLLRVFIAVAESGGVTRSAGILHRSQSAVSMQIKRLEEILGVSVFDRTGTSVRLNEEGRIFIGYARRILRLVDEGMSKIKSKEHVTTIRLGCIEDYAVRILPRILAGFWQQHPNVHIEVSAGETPELLARLGSEYDLVLAMHLAGNTEGRVIHRESLVWGTSHTRSPHELTPMPVALRPDGCAEREWAVVTLEASGRPWRCSYVSSAIGTLQTAVEQGLAVGVFKESTIADEFRRLGPDDGFPELPEVEIRLHVAAESDSLSAVSLLVDSLAQGVRLLDKDSLEAPGRTAS